MGERIEEQTMGEQMMEEEMERKGDSRGNRREEEDIVARTCMGRNMESKDYLEMELENFERSLVWECFQLELGLEFE